MPARCRAPRRAVPLARTDAGGVFGREALDVPCRCSGTDASGALGREALDRRRGGEPARHVEGRGLQALAHASFVRCLRRIRTSSRGWSAQGSRRSRFARIACHYPLMGVRTRTFDMIAALRREAADRAKHDEAVRVVECAALAGPVSQLSVGAAAHKPAHAALRMKERRPKIPEAQCKASCPI
jgi:hypothetical protein